MTETLKYMDINPGDAPRMAQRLHQKKDEIQLIRKSYVGEKVAENADERSIVARVSTNDRDRDGEIVEPSGIDLSAFSRNSVLMWSHRYAEPPIGRALWSKVDNIGLICKFQFAKTQFADEIYQLYREGFLKAFSIGFIPLDFDQEEKIHKKISLLEVSAVAVPANENALVMEAYAKGIIKSETLKKDFAITDPPPFQNEPRLVDDIMEQMDANLIEVAGVDMVTKPETMGGGIRLPYVHELRAITKPETTENYHRIPVDDPDKHKGHKIRTMTVSEEKGIKALYCVDCKKIITYLFDKDKFTMDEAKRWVEDHKEGKAAEETEIVEKDEVTGVVEPESDTIEIDEPEKGALPEPEKDDEIEVIDSEDVHVDEPPVQDTLEERIGHLEDLVEDLRDLVKPKPEAETLDIEADKAVESEPTIEQILAEIDLPTLIGERVNLAIDKMRGKVR